MKGAEYVIITPARDEATTLPLVIESVRAQTIAPAEWVIVDDASRDDTRRVLAAAVGRVPFLRSLLREGESKRRVGPGVVLAFLEGLSNVTVEWDFVVKMDADIILDSAHMEKLLAEFARNPRLGILSGQCLERRAGALVPLYYPTDNSMAMCRMYRAACYREIGGIEPVLGWDTIDETRAHLLGWQTSHIDTATFVNQRLMGASEGGIWQGKLRHGRTAHYLGYQPGYLLGKSILRSFEPPYYGGVAMLLGYLSSVMHRRDRYYDPQVIERLRNEKRLGFRVIRTILAERWRSARRWPRPKGECE